MPLGSAGSGYNGESSIAIPPDRSPNAGAAVAGGLGVTGGESAAIISEIPKPATEAAAVGEVESDEDKRFLDDAFHFGDAEAGVMIGTGSDHGNAIGSGVTGGESAAAFHFDTVNDMPVFLRRTREIT
jgi:hypothetical protein